MDGRKFTNDVVDSLKPGKAVGSVVRSLLIGALLLGVGLLREADLFLTFAVTILVSMASLLIMERLQNQRAAWLTVGALAVGALAIAVLTAVERRNAANEKSATYDLTFEGGLLLRNPGRPGGPNGKLIIEKPRWRLDVGNLNDFPVFAQVVSRYGSLEGKGTALRVDKEEASEIFPIESGQALQCTTDFIPITLYAEGEYSGDVSCVLRYSRSKDDLLTNKPTVKTFDLTRKAYVHLCVGPQGDYVCDKGFS